ncbi:MAG: DUF1611 domain-containing protein [Halobacteriales archaeon]|nr:DUF1611 domain-containing protein [Halobacteriales archaeon]
MRVVLLAHEKFPDRAKTAVGILRYADHEVVAVLDRDTAGSSTAEHLPDVPDVPIVDSMAAVTAPVDALIIGISPQGGALDPSWRADITGAIERGCDVISGLHTFLDDDDEIAALAAANDVDLWDVRKPDPDIALAQGIADSVEATVVLTVGTDCSVGKMTTTVELVEAARERGIDAAFIPTGQTGIMIENWGHPIDRVIADFAAGAVEDMVLERGTDHDLLFVEGQGTIIHPAYSGVTASILHGAMPDAMVLCHHVGREAIRGYEDRTLPPVDTYVDLYEGLATPVFESAVVAGSLNTSPLGDDDAARDALAAFSEDIGVPTADPVRFEADPILDALP